MVVELLDWTGLDQNWKPSTTNNTDDGHESYRVEPTLATSVTVI
jgi:hypothetical protein